MMSDSEGGSSDEEGAYMSAAEELSLSPTPHNYETPLNSEISGDSIEERGEGEEVEEEDDESEEKLEERSDAGLSDVAQPIGDLTCKEMESTFSEEHPAGENVQSYEGGEDAVVANDAAGGLGGSFFQESFGQKFLEKLDRHFQESPRLIMRGIFRGEVLELQAKRRTEGTLVEWKMINTRTNTTVLNVRARMTYKYSLGLSRQEYGRKVRGGWAWRGFGYGHLNLFPGSDSNTKHIDLDEAVFPDEHVEHHFSGTNCKNVEKEEGVGCHEDGCGVKIWGLTINSFTTAVHKPDAWELPFNLRRDQLKEKVYLSLIAFPSSGESKILLHRDGEEKSFREVAWMTKVNDYFDDRPDVDLAKLQKYHYIWDSTAMPRDVSTRENNDTTSTAPQSPRGKDTIESNISQRQNNNENANAGPLNDVEGEDDFTRGEARIANKKMRLETQKDSEEDAIPDDPNLLYDFERAVEESRRVTPMRMTQREMVQKGKEFMARLGLHCELPNIFIPPDGDCLWSCFARFYL